MVPYLFNTSATPVRRYKQQIRGDRGSAEISKFSLHHMARLPSKPFFTTFCLAVTQHHMMNIDQLIFSSSPFPPFSFLGSLPVLVLSLLSCLRPLGLPGCYAFPTLYYIKITLFFSHFCPVKLLHWLFPNKYSSSSLDLLNPPKKPATNPDPYWLHRFLWALLKLLPRGSTAPSSAFLTLIHLRSPYFPAKLCLRLSPAYFCVLTFLNLPELETLPDSHGFFPPSLFNIPAKEYKEEVYTQIQKEILRSWGNTRSSVWYFVSSQTVKQHSLAIHTENICFKIPPRISSRHH